jgi:endo-1,4-beta-xylanase
MVKQSWLGERTNLMGTNAGRRPPDPRVLDPRLPYPGKNAARRRTWPRLTAALAAAAISVAAAALAAGPASAATSLKSLAEAKGRYFGTAMTQNLLSNSTVTTLAAAQFDMVTPGNEMKWDTTEPSNGSYNFGPGDQIVSFAQSHGMRVRGHNLVWHSQLPSWVSSLPLNQVRSAMESHITTEVTHYRGKVYSWDVVNEPFNDDGSFRQDVFYNAMGSGYIADALRTAHAADPNAKLYLNDYNIEGENAKSNAMYSLVQSLLAQGVPINGVGLESHFIVGQVPSSLLANMQRFAALGVDVAITELDDRIQLPTSTATLNQQATDFSTVVSDCLQVSRCVGVSQWAVGDADSWIPGAFSGYGAATMFDQNYQPKPAYNAVVAALGGSGGGGGGGSCTARYQETQQWTGGFNGQVTITAGGTAISSWTSTVTLAPSGQVMTATWNGTPSWPQANVLVMKPASYNSNLAAGQSTTFGFTVSTSNGNYSAPAVTCSTP